MRGFPGWRMVRTLAVTEMVGYGVLYYAFAVFLVPVQEELGISVAVLTGAFSLALAVSAVAAPLVGRWLDRYGARVVMTVGSVLGAGALVLWASARDVVALYVAFTVLGLSWAAGLYEPAFALIARWFIADRNRALLVLTVVGGLASTVFVPLSQVLISGFGWRSALLVLAVVVGACAVPHFLILRRDPGDLGLVPDGRPAPAGTSTVVPRPVAAPGSWNTSHVRWLTVSAVAETAAVTVVAVHLVAYLRSAGSTPGLAAVAAGSLGILSVVGRVVATSIADRWGMARVTAALVAGQAVGVLGLVALRAPVGVVVFVVLFGAGFGIMTLARAALLSTYVPAGAFGRVSGRQTAVVSFGRVLAPLAAGVSVTWSGGYGYLLGGVAAFTLVAAGALLLARARARAVGIDS